MIHETPRGFFLEMPGLVGKIGPFRTHAEAEKGMTKAAARLAQRRQPTPEDIQKGLAEGLEELRQAVDRTALVGREPKESRGHRLRDAKRRIRRGNRLRQREQKRPELAERRQLTDEKVSVKRQAEEE